MEEPLHEFTVAERSLRYTALPPCEVPKPEPVIVTWLPIVPADTPLMTGGVVEVALMETLSNVAVASTELFWLVMPKPMYTLVAMLIVTLDPICAQFTPSGAT
jgi:hypothetical protein